MHLNHRRLALIAICLLSILSRFISAASYIYIQVYCDFFLDIGQGLEFKGQMLYCHESDCLLFLASPLVDGLEALTSRGLYISDIPIHDATRDIVLVGEQSRAQVCIIVKLFFFLILAWIQRCATAVLLAQLSFSLLLFFKSLNVFSFFFFVPPPDPCRNRISPPLIRFAKFRNPPTRRV